MTENKPEIIHEQPPVFRNWSSWYALVLGTLAGVIIVLYLLTSSYK